MMKRIAVMVSIILSLLFLSACRDSGSVEIPETSTSGETESRNETEASEEASSSESEAPITDFLLKADNVREFSIIYAETSGSTIKDCATALKERVREWKFTLSIRAEKAGEAIEESQAGIFIGLTSHPSSQRCYETLKAGDYVISVEGNQIFIVGGSNAATEEAVNDFLQNYLKDFESEITFPSGILALVEKSYLYEDVVLCGKSISDYEIVISEDADAISRYAATLISTRIGHASGIKMDVVQENHVTGKAQIHLSSSATGLSDNEYSFRQKGDDIELAATKRTLLYAVREMTDCLTDGAEGQSNDITPEFAEKKKMILTETALPASLEGTVPIALCDQKNNMAVVIDLSADDPTSADAVLWEWSPNAENGFTGPGFLNQIDEIRLRYSEVLETYIICTTSSAGFMGIAEYPSGQKIWEVDVKENPHSIEYLPNGLVACALSTGGDAVRIYGRDADGNILATSTSSRLNGAHAVLWDAEFGVLWALGTQEIVAYEISGTTENPVMTRIAEFGCRVAKGHDFSLIPTGNGFYWYSGNVVGVFSKYDNALLTSEIGQSTVTTLSVKSVGTLPDGRIVRAAATGVFASHDTDTLVVFTPNGDGTFTKTNYEFPDRAFYKARPFLLY